MKQDLLQQNPHSKNADFNYTLVAYSGYTAEASHRGVSAVQYGAIVRILNQTDNRYIHGEIGFEVTLLFTAQGTDKRGKVVVYVDDNSNLYTCSAGVFYTEFSKI